MLARISSSVMGLALSGSSHSTVATSGGRPGNGAYEKPPRAVRTGRKGSTVPCPGTFSAPVAGSSQSGGTVAYALRLVLRS